MIKKVLVILLMLVLLFPVDALANDGGAMLDDNKYLSIDVKFDSKEAEIGGDFSFTVTFKNNSVDIIDLGSVGQIFYDNWLSDDDATEMGISDIVLNPGKKATLDIVTTVPHSIICYEKKGTYYTDFDFNIYYFLEPVDKENGFEKRHVEFYENKSNKIPIKITNVYDGSEYLKLELQEKETICYFPDYQNHNYNIYDEYLSSTVTDTLKVTNTSNNLITNLYIEDLRSRIWYDDKSVLTLDSKKNIEVEIRYYNFIHQRKLPKKLTAKYMINYKIGDKYYTTHINKTYPVEILNCPILDVTKNNDYVTILNTSSTDLTELYVDVNCNEYHDIIYNEDNIIPILHKDSNIQIPYSENTNKIEEYIVGLIREGKIYLWNIDNINKTPYYNYEELQRYFHIKEILPTPTPSPTPSPTLSPTSTPAPTSTKEITPEPTQVIEVTNITKESSMPWWVWVVLAFAIVGVGTVIYVYRNKNKNEDSK